MLPYIESDSNEKTYKELKESIIRIIGEIVRFNGKKELYKYLYQLSIVEYKTRDFEYSKRDHVVHSDPYPLC